MKSRYLSCAHARARDHTCACVRVITYAHVRVGWNEVPL